MRHHEVAAVGCHVLRIERDAAKAGQGFTVFQACGGGDTDRPHGGAAAVGSGNRDAQGGLVHRDGDGRVAGRKNISGRVQGDAAVIGQLVASRPRGGADLVAKRYRAKSRAAQI